MPAVVHLGLFLLWLAAVYMVASFGKSLPEFIKWGVGYGGYYLLVWPTLVVLPVPVIVSLYRRKWLSAFVAIILGGVVSVPFGFLWLFLSCFPKM